MTDFWHKENFCKLHDMKAVTNFHTSKVPMVHLDAGLEQLKDKVLFPKKLAKAKEMLKTAKLPTPKQ